MNTAFKKIYFFHSNKWPEWLFTSTWKANGKTNDLLSTEFKDDLGRTVLISDANGNEWVQGSNNQE